MYKTALRVYRKRGTHDDYAYHGILIVIRVPAGAHVRRGLNQYMRPSGKQRVSKAIVEAFEELPGDIGCAFTDASEVIPYDEAFDKAYRKLRECASIYNPNFKYVIGKTVEPISPFNMNADMCCTSGIHCFETKEQAINDD